MEFLYFCVLMRKRGIYIQQFAIKTTGLNLVFALLLVCLNTQELVGQSQVTAITTTSSAAPDETTNVTSPSDVTNNVSANTNYNVLYGQGNNVQVTGYTVSGIGTDFTNFVFPDTLILRRTDGSRFVNIWYTLVDDANTPNGFNDTPDPDEISLEAEKVSDADAIYLSRNINAGYDNILVNDDDEAPNSQIQAQIERVDVIWNTGIVTCEPANSVFPVIERGGNDQIKIAAILSLDANGDPASYSSLIDIEDSDWPGGTTQGVLYDNFLVLRRQTVGIDPIPLINFGVDTSDGAQLVQGVAVSFTEFGITANQIVYGYSLFAFDTNAIDHTLTDPTTFPDSTKASDSGLDLVAGITAAVANDDCLTPATGPGGYKQALATWLKANESADVTTSTDGSDVTDWQDHWLGNNDAVTSGTTTNDPDYQSTSSDINFNPTVFFRSDQETSLTIANNTDFNTATSYTNKGLNIAFRTSTSDITERQVLYEQGGSSRGIIVYIESSNLHVSAWNRTDDDGGSSASPWNDGTNITTVSTSVTTDVEYIVTMELDGSSAGTGTLTAYLQGASFGSISNVVGQLFSDTDGIEIGASDGATQYAAAAGNSDINDFEGEISEFIYCNEPADFALSQRNRIESYLAIKYGITLDQSSPYDYVDSDGITIFDATNNASVGGYLEYNNDIAGIGRDDGSELSQQKSKSENSGSIVTMDNGTTFGTDDTYLIWGNDGGATSTQSSDAPPLISNRLTREWRVAEQNDAGNVSVSFDLTGLGLSSSASDFALLTASNSSDNDFSSASITTGGTFDGNVLTFTNVDFADGEYFTLGTGFISCGPGGVTTNLSLWLKADLGPSNTTNGGDVSTWEDRAGSNDATAPAAGDEPNYVTNSINYNPALNFEGTNADAGVNDEELEGSAGFYSDSYYLVFEPENDIGTGSDTEAVVGFGADLGATSVDLGCLCIGAFNGDVFGEIATHAIGSGTGTEWRRSETDVTFTQTYPAGVPMLFGIRNANTMPESTEIYRDGEEVSNATGASAVHISSTNEDYMVGNFNSGTTSDRDFNGRIAEVISYSSRPSDAEHNRIQTYLAVKYGITLSNSGGGTAGDYTNSASGTIWDASDNSTYHNDIGAIGRDDDSCLDQRQSMSESTDAIVGIGNNTIAATNQDNTNAFSADESFLVWGNDNAANNFAGRTTGVTGIGSVTERMTRIWHVEESGTVGDLTISFDLTDLGFSTSASDFTFIQSASASLTSATTYTNGTFDGNVLSFSGIDLADEEYFTIGTAVSTCGPGGVTTDLSLWLQADSDVYSDAGTTLASDGGDIQQWNDQSSSPNNASESNLAGLTIVEPTLETSEINFNPVVRFTDPGSDNSSFMETSSNSVSGDFTLIAVMQTGQNAGTQDDFTTSPAIIGAETTVSTGLLDYGLGMESGQIILNASSGDAFDVETTNTFNDNLPHIVMATRVQSSGALEVFVDGNSEGSGTAGATAVLSEPASFGIGNHSTEAIASQFNGDVAEAIVFADDLTSGERDQVESYLAIKYGITLSNTGGGTAGDYHNSAGTTIWDASALSTYHNDVAGLARDDGSCLTQTKSRSENSDGIVTMEISSLTTDNSFMLWGNDNESIEGIRNSERPASINSRLKREWLIEESGTVGTVSITFDLSAVGGPSGVGTNNLNLVRLMTDPTDSDFTSGVTLTAPTSVDASANTVTFEFDFTDGMYYTLGSTEYNALPITLVHFDAKPVDNSRVKVEWTTAEEIGNAFFTVERSQDGTAFTAIGAMDGAGDSNQLINYEFIDNRPLNGPSFYRLKQTDFNGEFEYSWLVRVYVNRNEDIAMSLYPNPVDLGDNLRVAYNVVEDTQAAFSFISASGAVLKSEERLIVASEEYVELSTKGLRKGLHILRVVDEQNHVISMKVIIR